MPTFYKHLAAILLIGIVAQLNAQEKKGFFSFTADNNSSNVILTIKDFDKEFLYVNSLSAGVGSNDIGLDRGQLGNTRIVKFVKAGDKILLVEPNYAYRAVSNNVLEKESVEQAFAQSVIWGFEAMPKKTAGSGPVEINLAKFLMRDAHGVADRLAQRKQGSYKLDESKSALYHPRIKNFPKNSEFEVTLTFTGKAKGEFVRSVVPSPNNITVRQHHSFIELPDDKYIPRKFDPRSGYGNTSYFDYATPIEEPIKKQFINRHRLLKKNPGKVSEAIEPIIYYIDAGCPEPIKSALMEGASWWNQAFEAAGFIDAFQVKELPEGADPMDVRYNMIQWVHRSTRGWSYGASVRDPRTGEIIKGHVSLGSLRVRQDFLIAQGLINAYESSDDNHAPMLELALARLRQLSAHEVGHTIGLSHNFAASTNDRASVMDYPHPLIEISGSKADFSNAYDVGIGAWDERAIMYGYQEFVGDEANGLRRLLEENEEMGLKFISDRDARPAGGMHPDGHLWDNGSGPIEELERLSKLRSQGIKNFGLANIRSETPLAYLENVFVPLYLSHRYQVEAVAKMIGGINYNYAVKNDNVKEVLPVSEVKQKAALNALLNTLNPEFLMIPKRIISLIPPQPPGSNRDRELFKNSSGFNFDPLAAAESSAGQTLNFLLHPERLARIIQQAAIYNHEMDLNEYLAFINSAIRPKSTGGYKNEIKTMEYHLFIHKLIAVARSSDISPNVKIGIEKFLVGLYKNYQDDYSITKIILSKYYSDPSSFEVYKAKAMPAGSPIGCGEH